MTVPLSLVFTISGLGESTVVITTALLGAGVLWLTRQHRVALIWLSTIIGCAATTAMVKLAFLTCGHLMLSGRIATPSGHAAMASAFYAMIALSIQHAAAQTRKLAHYALATALVIALAVGLSRLALHAHNAGEVAIGLALGCSWALGGALMMNRSGTLLVLPKMPLLVLLALVYGALLVVAWSGAHLSAEGVLHQIAAIIHARTGVCRP